MRTPYTRSPIVESIKMFRDRNATGECVRRCNLRLFSEEPKTGSSSGGTFSVHEGGFVRLLAAACSTVAAT